jgi:hypothetical protein
VNSLAGGVVGCGLGRVARHASQRTNHLAQARRPAYQPTYMGPQSERAPVLELVAARLLVGATVATLRGRKWAVGVDIMCLSCVAWLGSGCRFDSGGVVAALLLIAAPLLFRQVADIKNRLIGAVSTTKGVTRMTKVIAGVEVTLYNIGCGLAGGIMSQTRPHSTSAISPLAELSRLTPSVQTTNSDARTLGVTLN